MDAASSSESIVKVGVVHHYIRWMFIVLGAVALGTGIWGFSSWESATEQTQLVGFDAFRAAYAENCGVASYARSQPEVVNRAYAGSPELQAVMARELMAMRAATTTCETVAKDLRDVSFIVPKPGSEP
jgi:hypothetical protein